MSDDELEALCDEQVHGELVSALMGIIQALEKLSREDRIRILTCARQFYDLPRSE